MHTAITAAAPNVRYACDACEGTGYYRPAGKAASCGCPIGQARAAEYEAAFKDLDGGLWEAYLAREAAAKVSRPICPGCADRGRLLTGHVCACEAGYVAWHQEALDAEVLVRMDGWA